ncbi:nucleotide triphosphate diphosphatase NUDT15 [Ferrimonas marina]|uniref:ADP-ribose pyrophosphatase YjhB, NUDIX family n=1 Tax=Ferrimonas marina TaxID=299255 RepID=A0A1M5QXT0_9GAMM|nr:NUDIX domain-containing protein [Ferrimonas marina]SHH19007.1 ADP-ribose pyrophosphatase YjhB, NUDIX family [Ferrimonas marina]
MSPASPSASSTPSCHPKVGIGVILVRQDGHILVGKRTTAHAPFWSIPGGHLEMGEQFEQTAMREMQEETGLIISEPKVIAVTNNLRTYALEGVHTISVCLVAQHQGGEPQRLEPDKCAEWRWVDPTDLPQPHFDASEQSVACYLEQRFYQAP